MDHPWFVISAIGEGIQICRIPALGDGRRISALLEKRPLA
jgi:hypothetical protein